jgi:hypothetical protein
MPPATGSFGQAGFGLAFVIIARWSSPRMWRNHENAMLEEAVKVGINYSTGVDAFV